MKPAHVVMLLAAVIALPIAAQTAPTLEAGIQSNFSNGMMVSLAVAQAPPSTQYTIYYVTGNPFLNPNVLQTITPLFSAVTDGAGANTTLIPVQLPPSVYLSTPEIWIGGVFTPSVGPPVVSGLVGLELSSNPVFPQSRCALFYQTLCVIQISAFVAPGSYVELRVNGVSIDYQYSVGGGEVSFFNVRCLFPSDSAAIFVDGVQQGASVHGGP